jgi:hypothetical protein
LLRWGAAWRFFAEVQRYGTLPPFNIELLVKSHQNHLKLHVSPNKTKVFERDGMLPDLAHGDRVGDPEVGVHVLVIPGKITKIFSLSTFKIVSV